MIPVRKIDERESRLLHAAAAVLKYYGLGAHGIEKLQKALEEYSTEEQENAK